MREEKKKDWDNLTVELPTSMWRLAISTCAGDTLFDRFPMDGVPEPKCLRWRSTAGKAEKWDVSFRISCDRAGASEKELPNSETE